MAGLSTQRYTHGAPQHANSCRAGVPQADRRPITLQASFLTCTAALRRLRNVADRQDEELHVLRAELDHLLLAGILDVPSQSGPLHVNLCRAGVPKADPRPIMHASGQAPCPAG
jgi:hypothetical protein